MHGASAFFDGEILTGHLHRFLSRTVGDIDDQFALGGVDVDRDGHIAPKQGFAAQVEGFGCEDLDSIATQHDAAGIALQAGGGAGAEQDRGVGGVVGGVIDQHAVFDGPRPLGGAGLVAVSVQHRRGAERFPAVDFPRGQQAQPPACFRSVSRFQPVRSHRKVAAEGRDPHLGCT